ncbi:hypothetical protein NQ015_04910 [Corynebacterium sp. 153RC1]|uniref:hypothetical protein n=1 Tax=unclassified Corynebacterium TaxID=2624378 RepID=UPI00211C646C|nr:MULTISPECIES: hypothetical protein [unclassified Corynebacterium]MCQ9352213.1 hypothetical protein [Corynebacterium sp. 209RC1]MCQ9354216.1 hypothetical protein [Corynebacterium sp. 1222RC1]MCQ9356496.1 hypothetical protein [Corynebacterium sp. 122RC1]MCQ9358598.1 hypothetical protein [Corynebacterium sp. 142RC1]MCQ9361110.1 hypothetical protein [Corynebacterium sp. 153RC1]
MEQLSTRAKQLLILCIVAVAGLMAIILAASAVSQSSLSQQDKLDQTLSSFNAQGLTASAVSLTDMYGSEYVAGAVLCPGLNSQSVASMYGVEESQLNFTGEIAEDENYILLAAEDGTATTRHFERTQLDMCSSGNAGQPFNASGLLPVVRTEQGGWVLMS